LHLIFLPMNDRSLLLLRGLPGSGKSTLAKLLAENGKYPVLSIDSYFTDPVTGVYAFDPYQNHLAYKQCEASTRAAMERGISKVFVDNTFTIDWEIEPYFKLAAEFNYDVFVLTVENHHGNKNLHGIPEEQLKKMAEKYKVKLL
jgi:predicted kinase